LPEPIEEGDLSLGAGGFPEDIRLADFHAGQFPLRDRHLFQIELFGPGVGLPFGFQIVAKLMEFLAVFAGQDDGAGAKAVTEGVQANDGLSLGSFGAGRL